MDPHALRKEYSQKSLKRKDLAKNPLHQFKLWLDEAIQADLIEPNAMSLATATLQGKPSCRTVLMKAFDEKGFVFFTNMQSRKAQELKENPQAAAIFWWHELERQVTLEGKIEETAPGEAETYFSKRPRGSQLGTWSSQQDQSLESREKLEAAYNHAKERFSRAEVPMPPYWGGFRLIPTRYEFWQGRSDRLHDRFVYVLKEGNWQIERLSP